MARDSFYIAQNKRLGAFAQSGNWRGMLDYADETCSTFNHVCWATLFNKLGKMKEEAAAISSDVVFLRLVQEFERRAESEGLDWIGVRELANVVHGLGAGLVVTSY